jgi:hypothetical protein
MATTTTGLDAVEKVHGSPQGEGVGFVKCGPCQDFRTDVTYGREHPCPHCQPLKYKAWRISADHETLLLAVPALSQLATIVLPPNGGSVIQPCDGSHCDKGCVLVRSIAGGGAWWAELDDVEIVDDPDGWTSVKNATA